MQLGSVSVHTDFDPAGRPTGARPRPRGHRGFGKYILSAGDPTPPVTVIVSLWPEGGAVSPGRKAWGSGTFFQGACDMIGHRFKHRQRWAVPWCQFPLFPGKETKSPGQDDGPGVTPHRQASPWPPRPLTNPSHVTTLRVGSLARNGVKQKGVSQCCLNGGRFQITRLSSNCQHL